VGGELNLDSLGRGGKGVGFCGREGRGGEGSWWCGRTVGRRRGVGVRVGWGIRKIETCLRTHSAERK
jgi:hypothetical protein